MKIRTVYFKVPDVKKAASFWEGVLQVKPHKTFDTWQEFMCGSLRLGLLRNDFGDTFSGSGCVPAFEFTDETLPIYIDRAKSLGATVVINGLNDPNMKSIAFKCPFGHEFEFSRFHD
jgi:catechol 2,3-dioxygenase-like lactoylglutathione lyase family enzyme